MPDAFQYNIFLSHTAKDKAVVRPLAERLRTDGVKVWFDEWVLKPVVPVAHQMGEGARRAGEGCMSAHAYGSDWAQLESGTLRTGQRPSRDPLNKERRFLPLCLDDAPIKGSWFRKDDVRRQFADRAQSRALATVRDTLLPKLLSGELATCAVNGTL